MMARRKKETENRPLSRFRIEAYRVAQKPDYMPLARHMMTRAFEFYEDPESEKRFQEWMAAGGPEKLREEWRKRAEG